MMTVMNPTYFSGGSMSKEMDRIDLLKPLINLQKDEFFVIRILKRRKDNSELENQTKQLKTYCFFSWDDLLSQYDRIKELCDLNNARAYIRLNKQNSVDVSLRCIEEISQNIRNGNSHKNKGVWESVSGKLGAKDWWFLDLDDEHLHLKQEIVETLSNHYFERFKPDGIPTKEWSAEVYRIIENPTNSGVHIICRPFDTRILKPFNKQMSDKGLPTIQIQKDANTVLYIGNPANKN